MEKSYKREALLKIIKDKFGDVEIHEVREYHTSASIEFRLGHIGAGASKYIDYREHEGKMGWFINTDGRGYPITVLED